MKYRKINKIVLFNSIAHRVLSFGMYIHFLVMWLGGSETCVSDFRFLWALWFHLLKDHKLANVKNIPQYFANMANSQAAFSLP